MKEGYVKLTHDLLYHRVFKSPKGQKSFQLYMHLFYNANYIDKIWEGILVKRGQLITSNIKIKEALNMKDDNELRRLFRYLIAENMVVRKPLMKNKRRGSIITVLNYSIWQGNKGPHVSSFVDETVDETVKTKRRCQSSLSLDKHTPDGDDLSEREKKKERKNNEQLNKLIKIYFKKGDKNESKIPVNFYLYSYEEREEIIKIVEENLELLKKDMPWLSTILKNAPIDKDLIMLKEYFRNLKTRKKERKQGKMKHLKTGKSIKYDKSKITKELTPAQIIDYHMKKTNK